VLPGYFCLHIVSFHPNWRSVFAPKQGQHTKRKLQTAEMASYLNFKMQIAAGITA
jgi:hypothetical protein